MKTVCPTQPSLAFLTLPLCGAMAVLVLISVTGCASDYNLQFENSISRGDYAGAKTLMKQQIKEYSLRDYNATLLLRLAQSYYHLAYAHGKLGEYDSMKIALYSSVSRDGNVAELEQKMIDHFATEEYNKAAKIYNAGDYESSLKGLHTALSIVGTEKPNEECGITILRGIASAAAATGNIKDAQESCRKAAALGDAVTREMLAHFENGETPKPLTRLEPRKSVGITGL